MILYIITCDHNHEDSHTMGALQGRTQDFKLGGGALKKLRRAEGGAKIVGFRV